MSAVPTLAISGVSRGIGEGVARAFLAEGWRVQAFGRSKPSWFDEFGDAAVLTQCDFADPVSVQTACAAVNCPIDVLICSAATFGGGAFNLHDFDPAAFSETMAVNVISPALMARELHPRLQEGARRLLVMMSTGNASLAGNSAGSMLAYRASKSALNQVMRNLAAEWGPHGFTAVALNPGWVRTDMGGAQAPLSVDEASKLILSFVTQIATPAINGAFVNTDGSALPW